MAEALKQSGQSIAGLDDDTLLDCSKKLLPGDKVIAFALAIVSRYREPSDSARPRKTHYRPSREDDCLIREAAEAGFGRAIAEKNAANCASSLRKLAAALRPLSLVKLSHKALLGHADTLFPNDNKLIYALNRLSDYRAIAGQDNSGGEASSTLRLPAHPAADLPAQLFDHEQPLMSSADRGAPSPADGFNAPQVWQGMGLAAHSPVQRVAQDMLFDAVARSSMLPGASFDAPEQMRSAIPSPVQSFAQEALFEVADREGLLTALTFDVPVQWQWATSAARSPGQGIAQEQLFDAVERGGSAPADGFNEPELWPMVRATARPPVPSVGRENPFDAVTRQPDSLPHHPASEEYVGRMIDRDGAAPAALDPPSPANSESFDASLVVREDFSHGSQSAPDMMLSKLGRWGLLPDAAQPVRPTTFVMNVIRRY
ncbi:hypothetical protein [Bradyrhizobium sp. USDA 4506]